MKPPTDTPERTKPGPVRSLTITVAVLAVALAGLGAWVLYDLATKSDTAVTAEIDQLFENYTAAYDNHDADALRALITEDFMIYQTGYDPLYARSTPVDSEVSDIPKTLARIRLEYPALEVHWERVGEPIMTGIGPWLVSQALFTTIKHDPLYPGGIQGISTLTVVDEDGTLKVARDVFVAFGLKYEK